MLVAEYDYDTDIAVQRQESLRIGIQQGAYQKAIETATALKQLGIDITKIAKMTGLSIKEIEKL